MQGMIYDRERMVLCFNNAQFPHFPPPFDPTVPPPPIIQYPQSSYLHPSSHPALPPSHSFSSHPALPPSHSFSSHPALPPCSFSSHPALPSSHSFSSRHPVSAPSHSFSSHPAFPPGNHSQPFDLPLPTPPPHFFPKPSVPSIPPYYSTPSVVTCAPTRKSARLASKDVDKHHQKWHPSLLQERTGVTDSGFDDTQNVVAQTVPTLQSSPLTAPQSRKQVFREDLKAVVQAAPSSDDSDSENFGSEAVQTRRQTAPAPSHDDSYSDDAQTVDSHPVKTQQLTATSPLKKQSKRKKTASSTPSKQSNDDSYSDDTQTVDSHPVKTQQLTATAPLKKQSKRKKTTSSTPPKQSNDDSYSDDAQTVSANPVKTQQLTATSPLKKQSKRKKTTSSTPPKHSNDDSYSDDAQTVGSHPVETQQLTATAPLKKQSKRKKTTSTPPKQSNDVSYSDNAQTVGSKGVQTRQQTAPALHEKQRMGKKITSVKPTLSNDNTTGGHSRDSKQKTFQRIVTMASDHSDSDPDDVEEVQGKVLTKRSQSPSEDSESDLEIKEVACSTRPPTNKSKKKKHQVRPLNNDSESDFDIKEVRSQKQVACSSRPPTKSKKRKHQDQPSNKTSPIEDDIDILNLSWNSSDFETCGLVTNKVTAYLEEEHPSKYISGLNKQIILAYFKCLEPEPHFLRKRNLPKLTEPDNGPDFDILLSALPQSIEIILQKFLTEAKAAFHA